MRVDKSSVIALLAGLLFGAASFAVNASADCADVDADSIVVSSENGDNCQVYAMEGERLFIRCADGSESIERTFTKEGGES